MTRWDFTDGSWLVEHPPETVDPGSTVGYRWDLQGRPNSDAEQFMRHRSRWLSDAAKGMAISRSVPIRWIVHVEGEGGRVPSPFPSSWMRFVRGG